MKKIILKRVNTDQRIEIPYKESWDLNTVEGVLAAIDETFLLEEITIGTRLEIFPVTEIPFRRGAK